MGFGRVRTRPQDGDRPTRRCPQVGPLNADCVTLYTAPSEFRGTGVIYFVDVVNVGVCFQGQARDGCFCLALHTGEGHMETSSLSAVFKLCLHEKLQ